MCAGTIGIAAGDNVAERVVIAAAVSLALILTDRVGQS
jgi:hypothetical protein